MPAPDPLSPEEHEYYATFKAMVREHLPAGRQVLADWHAAFERYFQTEGIILSRRERFRLFQLILDEILEEIKEEFKHQQP